MVFNQLFLVYETMMIQCMYICTLIPCNGVDREINSIIFYSIIYVLTFSVQCFGHASAAAYAQPSG